MEARQIGDLALVGLKHQPGAPCVQLRVHTERVVTAARRFWVCPWRRTQARGGWHLYMGCR
jgi:hypothetical protein